LLRYRSSRPAADRIAAELIANRLNRDKSIIAFPRIFTLLTRIGALLPERVQRLSARSFRFKVTQRD
jgi:hypothetical protein